MKKTMYKLRQRFTWPGMCNDVRNYIRICHVCQLNKAKFKPKASKMFLAKHSTEPFHTVHLDFAELAKKSERVRRTKSFLVIIDEATRSCFARESKKSTEAVIHCLELLEHIDKIKIIISDNGRCFTSASFQAWLSGRGIRLITTSVYHPGGNGLAERKIRDLKNFMKMYENEIRSWKKRLDLAVTSSNNSWCRAIGWVTSTTII